MLETHLETESDIETTAPESPLDAPYCPQAPFELNTDREIGPIESKGKHNLSLSVVPEYAESVSGLGSGRRTPLGKLEVPFSLPHSPSKYRMTSSFFEGREEESYPIRTPSGMCTPMELASPLKAPGASPFRFNLSELAASQLIKKNTQRWLTLFDSYFVFNFCLLFCLSFSLLSFYLSFYLSIFLSIYLSFFLSFFRLFLLIYLSNFLSFFLSIYDVR